VADRATGSLHKIIAYCHDLVEDTDTTLDEIRELFDDGVANVVDMLTHRAKENYAEYMGRILNNHDAMIVKLADLNDNLIAATTYSKHRADKYRLAKMLIEDQIALVLRQEFPEKFFK